MWMVWSKNLLPLIKNNMNTSLLRKFVTVATSQWSLEQSIDTVDILLLLLKKFGKQLSQIKFTDFLQKEYPNVYDLYLFLWWSRCTLKQSLLLRQYLSQAMGDKYIVSTTSHPLVWNLSEVDDNIVVTHWGDIANPTLIVNSATKTYRRSLRDDLSKLI